MLHYGITADEIIRMVRVNPARVLGLPEYWWAVLFNVMYGREK